MNQTTTTASNTESDASLSQELRWCWNQLPDKAFFFTLLVAWLVLFQFWGNSTFGYVDTPSLYGWMANAYSGKGTSPEDEHGKLIPFVVLGLVWWKRKELLAQPLRPWWPGLLIVGAALALHLTGYLVQQQRPSIAALFLGIYGLMGLVWGPKWLRAIFFPFVLFVFCVPMAAIAEPITFPLRILVARIVEFLGQDVLGFNIIREGTTLLKPPTIGAVGGSSAILGAQTIIDPGFKYEVAAACGGMRSLIAVTAIAVIYGFMAFRENWKRALLIVAGLPLAVIGNVVRLSAVVFTAEFWGRDAGLWVHDNPVLSLLPYVPAIFGLLLLGRWLEGPRREVAKPRAQSGTLLTQS